MSLKRGRSNSRPRQMSSNRTIASIRHKSANKRSQHGTGMKLTSNEANGLDPSKQAINKKSGIKEGNQQKAASAQDQADRTSLMASYWMPAIVCAAVLIIIIGTLSVVFFSQSSNQTESTPITQSTVDNNASSTPTSDPLNFKIFMGWDICGLRSETPFPDEQTPAGRIAYGENAKDFEYPWVALLRSEYKDGQSSATCTASLLNSKFLLTAATCCHGIFSNNKPSAGWTIYVKLGAASYISLDSMRGEVDRCYINPGYEPNNSPNDVALLRLSNPFQEPNPNPQNQYRYNAICLTQRNILNETVNAEIAGYGEHGRPDDKPKEVVQKGRLRFQNSANCDGEGFSQYKLCFRLDQKTAHLCQGDLGGPLMLVQGTEKRTSLVGIAHQKWPSGQDSNCKVNPPIYMQWMNPHPYLNWINATIEKHWQD